MNVDKQKKDNANDWHILLTIPLGVFEKLNIL